MQRFVYSKGPADAMEKLWDKEPQ